MSIVHTGRKFRRATERGKVLGICAGFAYWMGVEVWIVRVLWLLLAVFSGGYMAFIYLLFVVIPPWRETPPDFDTVTGD